MDIREEVRARYAAAAIAVSTGQGGGCCGGGDCGPGAVVAGPEAVRGGREGAVTRTGDGTGSTADADTFGVGAGAATGTATGTGADTAAAKTGTGAGAAAGTGIGAGAAARTETGADTAVAKTGIGIGAGADTTGTGADTFGAGLYSAGERDALPAAAVAASLGCGNPAIVADLHDGETVLDLGSGGGIDVLLSARRVGPGGHAYGLDMTDEMLDLARRNATEAGASNVEFLKGHIEEIPLPDATVDVVISNCVINLSADKSAVFAEMARVLRPGGRIGVSDVVAEDRLTPAERAERGDWAGCVAGALSRAEYEGGLRAAGFADIEITFTHAVADGLHSALIRATTPR